MKPGFNRTITRIIPTTCIKVNTLYNFNQLDHNLINMSLKPITLFAHKGGPNRMLTLPHFFSSSFSSLFLYFLLLLILFFSAPKVAIFLNELNVPFELVFKEFGDGPNGVKHSDYTKYNPNGRVPAIIGVFCLLLFFFSFLFLFSFFSFFFFLFFFLFSFFLLFFFSFLSLFSFFLFFFSKHIDIFRFSKNRYFLKKVIFKNK
jgi:Glutathione S-transferase, N-terminal domain